ncbi:hypothetical protein [Methylomonas koyamae]|uniref:hypothetical protein n=1 Tax=Methylomonas koyamae TaxID=702114 RepID=UPI002873230A|nr:hypothetical protein [Methylomonas koyamae]WNB74451.1 hypothetical protein RI210_14300 [Methylomonas koyamae]
MTAHQKKNSELTHLEKALQLLHFSEYQLLDKDGESPDFLININGKEIGVEVTNIYRNLGNSNSAKTQSDLPVIAENAVKIYSSKGGIPLAFGFSYNEISDVNSRRELSQILGDFLFEHISKHFPKGVRNIQEINIKTPSIACSVFAQPTDQKTSVCFTVSAFNSKFATGAILEKAIRKKEKLLATYKNRCNIVWLLLVLPSMKLADDLMLQDNMSIELSYDFDAVYVLDEYRNIIQSVIKTNKEAF